MGQSGEWKRKVKTGKGKGKRGDKGVDRGKQKFK